MGLSKKAILLIILLVLVLVTVSYLNNSKTNRLIKTQDDSSISPGSTQNPEMDESSFFPEVSFEGWQSSGVFKNPDNCEDFFIGNGSLWYCNLSGVQLAYSKLWKTPVSEDLPQESISLNMFAFGGSGNAEGYLKQIRDSLKSIPDEKTRSEYNISGANIIRYSQLNYFRKDLGNLSREDIEALKYAFSGEGFEKQIFYLDCFEKNGRFYLIRYKDSDESKARQIIEATLKL